MCVHVVLCFFDSVQLNAFIFPQPTFFILLILLLINEPRVSFESLMMQKRN